MKINNKLKVGLLAVFAYAFVYNNMDDRHFNGLVERTDGGEGGTTAPSSFLRRYLEKVYFCLVTVSTVGYGGISPATFECKMIAGSFLLMIWSLALSDTTSDLVS